MFITNVYFPYISIRNKQFHKMASKAEKELILQSFDTELGMELTSSPDNCTKILSMNDTATLFTGRSKKLVDLLIIGTGFYLIMAGLIFLHHSKYSSKVDKTSPAVSTNCGQVTGVIESIIVGGQQVDAFSFKGIPYAIPPVGDLRWSAPIALSMRTSTCWKGVFAATKFGSQCVQLGENGVEGSEDCLYMNVISPTLSNTAKLPVFVWIHGGFLMKLNGSVLGYSPDSEFVTSMNVVAVSMNYRLNAFGFLTLEALWQKDKSYGNYGFMDQILVLEWVKNNIINFGGDPDSVTLCGQSSGGTSIFGLLASPMANGLFHKAISMSGSPKFQKSYIDAAQDNLAFIHMSRCKNVTSGIKLKKCLYDLTATEITYAIPYNKYPYWAMSSLLDFPSKGLIDGALAVIEPVVVPKPPKDLVELFRNTSRKVFVLIGNTAQEIGVHPVVNFTGKQMWDSYFHYLKQRLDQFNTTFDTYVTNILYVKKTVRQSAEYMHETVTSDVRVICPSSQLRRDFQKSRRHNIYQYVVAHQPNKPLFVFGFSSKYSFHMWDSIVLFNFNMIGHLNYTPNNSDLKFKESLRENFKQFMIYGRLQKIGWEKGKTGLFTKAGNVEVLDRDYHENQCQFWNNVYNGFVPYTWIN